MQALALIARSLDLISVIDVKSWLSLKNLFVWNH